MFFTPLASPYGLGKQPLPLTDNLLGKNKQISEQWLAVLFYFDHFELHWSTQHLKHDDTSTEKIIIRMADSIFHLSRVYVWFQLVCARLQTIFITLRLYCNTDCLEGMRIYDAQTARVCIWCETTLCYQFVPSCFPLQMPLIAMVLLPITRSLYQFPSWHFK